MIVIKKDCPKCIGTGEIMEGRKDSKGFQYNKCNLCKGEGIVDIDIAEDYILSLDESQIDDYE